MIVTLHATWIAAPMRAGLSELPPRSALAQAESSARPIRAFLSDANSP